ncbi:MAG: flagellar motor protein MotB [Rubrivivax sp.]|jgi:chemotaxis protein MotB|nr:flagellar motor protein MotB [Betaproteobacteria bacterium]MBP6319746.1 flagellar motor protein MotB [Rubrivivax sp.]MBK7275521.1 flagellar motor protein MotB [Betaproteobacteria bacterium]MBK7458896.1 flagellar motor protein MotB [Betaproteobacteria bacterium]MBK7514707.1 flagellar motor protein MotB [Betaproteobacteria bacterium]
MAGDAKKLQPIIVKRVKKGGHGAHGGAWKIAYADFVTAMMAFFLLMWLLGSTTEGDKKGIADYFGSPLKMALLASGSGAGDAAHIVKGGGKDLTQTTGQIKRGEIEAPRDTINVHKLKAEQARAEVVRLQDLQRKVESMIEGHSRLAGLRSQILLDMTQDGLRIQIVDQDRRPMFPSGSAVVEPQMRELLREIGALLTEVPNRLTLEGHTDAQAYSAGERGYSNWELSSDRANASRRELVAGGLADDRVLRVQGLAASNPFDRKDPLAPTNRRISVVVMTRDAEERVFTGGRMLQQTASIAPDLGTVVATPSTTPAGQSGNVEEPGR